MKKRIVIIVAIVLVLLVILFVPFDRDYVEDGGTRTYTALTYKVVKWERVGEVYYTDGTIEKNTYSKTSIFWFPDNFKSIDELWEIENQSN
ncbi:MAG: hypothetical protein IJZ83_03000 [Clostridia bacterium]|nr:hypothetical protein [Clostridia bacterium]